MTSGEIFAAVIVGIVVFGITVERAIDSWRTVRLAKLGYEERDKKGSLQKTLDRL